MKKGFTLIEALVSISVFVLAMGAVTAAILQLYRTQFYTIRQADAVNEARKGIETLTKEIREGTTGADGAYVLAKTNDNEFTFFSDVDDDGVVERIRYFRGGTIRKSSTKECVTFTDGGSCGVNFSSFIIDTFSSAQVTVSVEGDFGAGNEWADISADGSFAGDVCKAGCVDCANEWEGSQTFDVSSAASDNALDLAANATDKVNALPQCDWVDPNHAMKAKFDFAWTENLPTGATNLMKGVTKPAGDPAQYLDENETSAIISQYVRNADSSPILRYFDGDGNELTGSARPEQTTLMRVNLIINVDPNLESRNFELESDVQIRNLKTNL